MINWTEEDITFICKNLLTPMSEEIIKVFNERDKLESKAVDKVFSVITDQFKEIRYEQERDRRFFLQLYSKHAYINYEKMQDVYKNWCEEFDKLNKDKFFKEKTDE